MSWWRIKAWLKEWSHVRLTTKARLDRDARRVTACRAHAASAELRVRQAQRTLAILSEPLKDWDVYDFPWWAAENVNHLNHVQLSPEDTRFLQAVVAAYGIVAKDAALLRGVILSDRTKGRGWRDHPVDVPERRPARRQPLDPARLP